MTTLTPDVLKLDEASEVAGIGEFVRGALSTRLRRRGVVPDYDSNRPHKLAVRGCGSSRVNHFYSQRGLYRLAKVVAPLRRPERREHVTGKHR
jgi:hypothetical protein